MPSVQQGRVAKRTTSSTPAGTSSRRLGARRNRDDPKPLPLVERTNKLPIEEFISSYMPPSAFEVGTKGPPESATQPTQGQSPAETGPSGREGVGSGPDYALDIYTAQSIPTADFEACFKLIEQTVANAYADSGMGWSATKKRREMRLPDMRYLILRRGQIDRDGDRGQLLGFLSFMVTYEDGKEVNYCYEIHLAPEAQGLGLGRQLMIRYEDIGRRIGLEKAMLTVFKSNAKAMRFYERLGYVVDDFSPEPRTLRNGTVKEPEYLILSKPLKGSASDGA